MIIFTLLFILMLIMSFLVFSFVITLGRKNYIFHPSTITNKFSCCPGQRVNVFKYNEIKDKKGRISYQPIFRYIYDGMDFYIKGYPLKKKKEFFEVIVKVNPKNPSEAVVWARGDAFNIGCAVFSIIILLCCIVFFGSYFLYA